MPAPSASPSAMRENSGSLLMNDAMHPEFEAAAFRRLVAHLRQRSDVQNIDLMELAGFCRNCLSDWYREAAAQQGVAIDRLAAREIVYGMPYEEWKQTYQTGPVKHLPHSGGTDNAV